MSIRDTVTGVQHVGIPTTDLEGTIAYYERLGFECLGIYPNGEDRCTFLRLNNLTLEVWTMNPTPMENGAINHFALDSTDIEASFAEAQKLDLNFVEGSIQHIDHLLEQRHPLLQRAWAEPRGHRILPNHVTP